MNNTDWIEWHVYGFDDATITHGDIRRARAAYKDEPDAH